MGFVNVPKYGDALCIFVMRTNALLGGALQRVSCPTANSSATFERARSILTPLTLITIVPASSTFIYIW